MKTNIASIISIYGAGFLQGVALIMFPAASNIFQSPDFHQLSSGQYGALFTPQIILAIISSLSAPALARRLGMKKVYLYGIIANILAMLLWSGSHFLISTKLISYVTLLLGTASLGAGFGFTITALNPFAYNLFPKNADSAVTALHVLLGAGTATSAILLNIFRGLGFWWGAGLLIAGLFILIWLLTLPLQLQLNEESAESNQSKPQKVPGRIWIYFTLVVFYGACEAVFGNFSSAYLKEVGSLDEETAGLGLSIFWGAIAVGRLLFTALALIMKVRWLHLVGPVLVAIVFFLLPNVEGKMALLGMMALAGLGLSFYFPYSISLATAEYPLFAAAISGILVAAIQTGTGLSSNITGLVNEYIPLEQIFRFSAIYALIVAIIAFYLWRTRPTEVD